MEWHGADQHSTPLCSTTRCNAVQRCRSTRYAFGTARRRSRSSTTSRRAAPPSRARSKSSALVVARAAVLSTPATRARRVPQSGVAVFHCHRAPRREQAATFSGATQWAVAWLRCMRWPGNAGADLWREGTESGRYGAAAVGCPRACTNLRRYSGVLSHASAPIRLARSQRTLRPTVAPCVPAEHCTALRLRITITRRRCGACPNFSWNGARGAVSFAFDRRWLACDWI